MTTLVLILGAFGGPVAFAWLDAKLLARRQAWAIWVTTVLWLIPWEGLWILTLHRTLEFQFHTVRQLFAYAGAGVFLPVLTFGIPAVWVAFIAAERDENGRRSSVRRSVTYGVVIALVTAPVGLFVLAVGSRVLM